MIRVTLFQVTNDLKPGEECHREEKLGEDSTDKALLMTSVRSPRRVRPAGSGHGPSMSVLESAD